MFCNTPLGSWNIINIIDKRKNKDAIDGADTNRKIPILKIKELLYSIFLKSCKINKKNSILI